MTDALTRRCAQIARDLASNAGDAQLPCPACAQPVKAANLDKHLSKVHSIQPGETGTEDRVRGSDARFHWVAMVGCVLATAFTLFVVDMLFNVQLAAFLSLLVFCAGGVPAGLALAGLLPASLRVEPDGLNLTRALGLRRSRATFPLRVETGSLQDVQQSGMVKDGAGYRGPWSVLRVGSYIGLVGANGARITVGSKRSTRPLKYWSFEHLQGRPRRAWHIQLSPEKTVQLQYLLSEHGVFRLRNEDAGQVTKP